MQGVPAHCSQSRYKYAANTNIATDRPYMHMLRRPQACRVRTYILQHPLVAELARSEFGARTIQLCRRAPGAKASACPQLHSACAATHGRFSHAAARRDLRLLHEEPQAPALRPRAARAASLPLVSRKLETSCAARTAASLADEVLEAGALPRRRAASARQSELLARPRPAQPRREPRPEGVTLAS